MAVAHDAQTTLLCLGEGGSQRPSRHEVFFDSHGVAVELDADFYHLAAFGQVGGGIAFAVNLGKCVLCRAVDFQLEYRLPAAKGCAR